ncbi:MULTISPECIES: AraC family transcriptional regulator [Halomonadaceae]|uniref:AraC family transcriptional regulator n=1 Tax=Onishia taeanensis TaxID=284577 RepID=A0A328XY68_9GAMM|nr:MULTISPECIES: AraC family transcriptional regulator [Halomonas]RAR61552.1 AraC family transcriptional regulator [Halomonas taeanensis]
MSFFSLKTCTLIEQPVAHEHGFHQLILATSGVTELSIEGRGERVTRERGCLIPSTYHHEYLGDGRNRTLVLDVPLAHLPRLSCGDEVQRLFESPRFFSVTPRLQSLAQTLMGEVEASPTLQSEIATLILRAIYLSLHERALPKTPTSPARSPYRERLDLARVEAYIDRHLAEAIHVDDLAGLCALSPGHFHACFREATGETPLHFVQRRRLALAQTLLQESDFTLGQIAERIGFCDQGSFSRAYRRTFQHTPSEYRRLAR